MPVKNKRSKSKAIRKQRTRSIFINGLSISSGMDQRIALGKLRYGSDCNSRQDEKTIKFFWNQREADIQKIFRNPMFQIFIKKVYPLLPRNTEDPDSITHEMINNLPLSMSEWIKTDELTKKRTYQSHANSTLLKSSVTTLHKQLSCGSTKQISRKNEKLKVKNYLESLKKLSAQFSKEIKIAIKLDDPRANFLKLIDNLIKLLISEENQEISRMCLINGIVTSSSIRFLIEYLWQRNPLALSWSYTEFVTEINELFAGQNLARFDNDHTDSQSGDRNEALRAAVINALKSLGSVKLTHIKRWKEIQEKIV